MRDRDAAILEARRLCAAEVVVFDTETNGLYDAEAVEIGIVQADGAVVLDTLVRPIGHIEESAWEVHGISEDILKDAPTMTEVLPMLHEAFRGKTVLSYNLNFDADILHRSSYMRGKPVLELYERMRDGMKGSACIMQLFAQFYGEWDDQGKDYTWKSLGFAAADCAVEVEGRPHRALTDARTALGVLRYMAERETSGPLA